MPKLTKKQKQEILNRVSHAVCAMDAYCEAVGGAESDEPMQDKIKDLMADTLHLYHEDGSKLTESEWIGMAVMAYRNFEAEQAGEL
jgi:hypothetical protein